MDTRGDALGPAVAGTWYPADRDALERQLDGLLRQADDEADPAKPAATPRALIAPHAGFVYSGLVAAKGFRSLRGYRAGRVVLCGPSHHAAFDGAVLPDATRYLTPLGEVPIDTDAVAALALEPGFRVDTTPFEPEHCLEAEIPFLQRCLAPGWRLLPLLVGGLGRRTDAAQLAAALAPFIEADTLVVVSSDFTHYGPRFGYVPFRDDVPSRLERLDRGAIDPILRADASAFERYVVRTGATICGRNPIGVLLRLPAAGPDGRLAAYDTSGRITGDWGHSVSYASVAFDASPR